MVIKIEKTFQVDVDRIADVKVLKRLQDKITEVLSASKPSEISNLTKLQGKHSYFRIKLGSYRIGLKLLDGNFVLVRFFA